jgi:cytochrome c-type biogenesis protein
MRELFQAIHAALGGANPQLALAAALLWGVCSVALIPCQIASIPLVVGYIDSQGAMAARRALAMSAVFALGILVSLAALSGLTALAGHILGGLGHAGGYLVAAVFLFMGANLLGLLPLQWSIPIESAVRRRGMLAGLLLGLIYGLSLGPCTLGFIAPVLALSLKVSAHQPLYALALMLAFAGGHCTVIIAAGTSAGLVQRYLDWNGKTQVATWLRRAAGVLLIAAGLYLLYMA